MIRCSMAPMLFQRTLAMAESASPLNARRVSFMARLVAVSSRDWLSGGLAQQFVIGRVFVAICGLELGDFGPCRVGLRRKARQLVAVGGFDPRDLCFLVDDVTKTPLQSPAADARSHQTVAQHKAQDRK